MVIQFVMYMIPISPVKYGGGSIILWLLFSITGLQWKQEGSDVPGDTKRELNLINHETELMEMAVSPNLQSN